jgi:hypothetical protein
MGLVSRGLLYGEVRGLGPANDPIDVRSCLPSCRNQIGRKAYQTSVGDRFLEGVTGRQTIAKGKISNSLAICIRECSRNNEQGLRLAPLHFDKGRAQIVSSHDIYRRQRHSERRRGFFQRR